jgi:hypothetical protein
VKEAGSGTRMAEYQVLSWRKTPSVIQAADATVEVTVRPPHQLQD